MGHAVSRHAVSPWLKPSLHDVRLWFPRACDAATRCISPSRSFIILLKCAGTSGGWAEICQLHSFDSNREGSLHHGALNMKEPGRTLQPLHSFKLFAMRLRIDASDFEKLRSEGAVSLMLRSSVVKATCLRHLVAGVVGSSLRVWPSISHSHSLKCMEASSEMPLGPYTEYSRHRSNSDRFGTAACLRAFPGKSCGSSLFFQQCAESVGFGGPQRMRLY